MRSGVGRVRRREWGSDEAQGFVAALFELYYVELVATARFLLGDVGDLGDTETAEDVVMAAFVSLHRHWASLGNPNEAHGFLHSSVLHGSRSQRRRRVVRHRPVAPDSGDRAGVRDFSSSGSGRTGLVAALRGVPARQREVLVLRYYLGMDPVEVAQQLGIGTGSVRQHGARGLAALAHGAAESLDVDDVGERLTAALTAAVETMDIDRRAAWIRLEQELSAGERQRRANRRFAAAAVLAVAALVGWAALGPPNHAMPVDSVPSPRPTTQAAPQPVTWPFLLDLRTLSMSPLPGQLVPEYPLIPAYGVSPDGTQVAAVKCDVSLMGCDGNPWIVVGSLEDLAVHRLTVPDAQLTDVISWSPDGTKIIVGSTDGSGFAVGELYLIDVASGRTRQITNIPLDHAWWWSLQTSFSPDGGSVLYDLPRGGDERVGWDIWSVPLTAAGSAKGTLFLRNAKGPKAIPGTASVAYIAPVPGSWQGSAIGIVDGFGSRRTLVTAQNGIGILVPSPDGRSIAYDDGYGTWVVDVATGTTRHVSSNGRPAGWRDQDTLLVVP
ncbi:sigma-70 family RNA polymerase sigma factor [Intrasporangium sp.]|uniref:sigma-70 family RNA polymerase sigma factor n=1 Tax=Intrasporangium sp. TaxID=1925024 RepID=UPI0033654C17